MKFHKLKLYAKYGLFLILVISLAGTASAATNHTGGIALCWDDIGNIEPCYENLTMFQQHNATCTIYINSVSESPNSTRTALNELHKAGWEIAAHGHNHKNSTEFLNNSTPDEWLDQEIFPNIVEITGYGYPIYSFAYPYSLRNETTDALLAPYFQTLRATAFETVNVNESAAYYKWNDTQLVYAVEIDDQTGITLESIQYGIDYAIANEYVLVLYGHAITSNVTGPYQTSTSRLESILNYTNQKNGTFYLMGELGDSAWVRPGRFSNVTANFTVSSDTVLTGGNVTFADYSVNQTSELLDFGDGYNSSTVNVTHTYSVPGTYIANLTVSNDVSNQSITKTITVTDPIPPVASFTSNPTTGVAPLNVAFTDTSTGVPTSWSWDFGDGTTSDEPSPTHVYSSAGTYTVKLTVTNANGENSKTDTIVVNRKSSGGSSNGGGGGGSPEPAGNVEVKELSQAFITNGKAAQFDFTKNATCVVCISFNAKKTAGRTTAIAEQLKNKSTLVSGLPEGKVYKYFNVWVGNSGFATSENIDNPALCFKVEKSWVQDNKINKDSITLNRYNNKTWEKQPTNFSREDDKYLYFKSSVSGYSFFAITGKTTEDAITSKPETQEDKNDTEAEANRTSVRRTRAPGFEMIYCILGLLGVFLYRRK
ncbi:cell surface protein [Methanosarcina horonobensis HB-1 = JCM 15518]|uniref:Cell surface protein n=1 Tax=Methanosarcina horonobensis HB-1 = JCM 15518 TaxID=1434110 RepID=A0A0E3WVZ1_9EURY|nr:PGF-pre-PGF domain-containing protein [Methanosarcina horonobensis]AKB78750.1 cell surface protein [Methanosarcina horonobensis HB-1 = JCM 15518]